MNSSLRARLAQLGPIQAVPRVASGSPVHLVIRPAREPQAIRTIDAIHALVTRHTPVPLAKQAVEAMMAAGHAAIHVPMVEDAATLADELAATGIACSQLMPPARADVRAIREALGLSAAAFAERFGLEAPMVEGWEQGQPIDAAANMLLTVIARDPDAVARILETPLARR